MAAGSNGRSITVPAMCALLCAPVCAAFAAGQLHGLLLLVGLVIISLISLVVIMITSVPRGAGRA